MKTRADVQVGTHKLKSDCTGYDFASLEDFVASVLKCVLKCLLQTEAIKVESHFGGLTVIIHQFLTDL